MFKLFKRYVKYYKLETIFAPIFKMFEAVFALLVPIIVQRIIDNGINGDGGTSYIINQGLILLALAVIGFAMTMVCQVLAVRTSSGYGFRVRNDMFAHISLFSLVEMNEFTSSSLETRLSSDVVITQKGLTLLLRLAIRAPFLVIGATVLSFVIAPTYGWIFIVTGVLLGIVIYIISHFSLPYSKKIQKGLDKVTSQSQDDLSGMRAVRAFNKEDLEKEKFDASCEDLEKISNRLAKVSSFLSPLNTFIVNAGIVVILYLGAKDVSSSSGITQGSVVALINYMNQIASAILVIANLVSVFTKSSASAKRILEVLDKKPSIVSGTEKPASCEMKVEFKDVTFFYNKESAPALSDISFTAKEGETIGIIGGTGSGKTTLADLMDRFYDPDKGEVKVNGIDIKNWDLTYLRKQIGYVNQRSVLFSGDLESNLKMGDSSATDEEALDALKVSQGDDILKKRDEGLKSEVVQGGKNFSGGQKQRISIARALVKKPQILILDDSSSALDFKTDYELRKAIKGLEGKMTVFIISQRVSSLNSADKILVLDKGNLVGCGKKDDLYKTCPIFKEISDSQLSREGD